MELFKRDVPSLRDKVLRIVPNYPPKSWQGNKLQSRPASSSSGPLKLVYVGSLSTSTTFVEEIIQWIMSAQGDATLDVFCYNSDSSISKLFEQTDSSLVRFHSGGIEYEAIPKTLADFDIGVILYKGGTTNYAFNATNKLFEYLAAGLDVWYPKEMLGVQPYRDESTSPRVIEVDFKQPETLSAACETFFPRPLFLAKKYYCEEALSDLYREIKNAS